MHTQTCNHWIFVSPLPAKAGRVPELTCQRLRKPTVRGLGGDKAVCVATSRGRSSEPSRHKQVLESSSRSVSPTRRHNKLASPRWSGYLILGANPLLEYQSLCRVSSSGTETPPAASGSLCCALLTGMTARGNDSDPRQTCSSKLRMYFQTNRGECKREVSNAPACRAPRNRAPRNRGIEQCIASLKKPDSLDSFRLNRTDGTSCMRITTSTAL